MSLECQRHDSDATATATIVATHWPISSAERVQGSPFRRAQDLTRESVRRFVQRSSVNSNYWRQLVTCCDRIAKGGRCVCQAYSRPFILQRRPGRYFLPADC
jgi:hypothetical protein